MAQWQILTRLLPLYLLSLPLQAEISAERGEYLLNAGGCIACHTGDEGEELAGGYKIESPFGTFYSPNITPDEETGIGNWSDDDFVNAFQKGTSPAGEHYYPAFPYTSYTGMNRDDLLSLKAYLDTVPPVTAASREHELVWYASWRTALAGWKWLYFNEARFEPDSEQTDSWNRGAYLVRHLGHCGECHTPRNFFGGTDSAQELAGAPGFGDAKKAPNLTPHEDGLKAWRRSAWELFLEIGMLPNGDFAGGSMSPVIDENTSLLSSADRAAMIEYLRSLEALPNPD